MARLAVFFQPPVVVRPRCHEAGGQRQRDCGRRQDGAAGDRPVGGVHRRLHRQHRDETHAERGSQRFARREMPVNQNRRFQQHAGRQAVDHRQRHDGQHRPRDAGELEEGDGAEVADGAANQAPHRVVGARPPCVPAGPEHFHRGRQSVTAPSEAERTSRAYLASTPWR